ncbi:hypothetical protein PspLS_05631 [Pyricularia sp. CBS 133598]|nr:hypothetical protein PspLS_05631 [Pyricularia sp. CBS 133598]
MANNSDAATVTLDIVSPSVGVPTPLTFPDLPAHTTIAQLQDKIRMNLTLPNRDAVAMRLIYHGRMLAQPDMKLSDAFGADAFHTDNRRVLHVVLMVPAGTEPSPTATSATQPVATTAREIIAQNQRERAARNSLGIQDQPPQFPTVLQPAEPPSMTSTGSAAQHTTSSFSGVPFPTGQAFSSSSDALWSETSHNMAEVRAREQANRFLEQLQATRARQERINQLSSQLHGNAEQLQAVRMISQLSSHNPAAPIPHSQLSQQASSQQGGAVEASAPEVYILNSPEGPYAVLLNNAGVYTSLPVGQPVGPNTGTNSAEMPTEPLSNQFTAHSPASGVQPASSQPLTTNDIRATEDTDFVERWRQDGQRRQFELRQRYVQLRQQHERVQEQLALRRMQDARRVIPWARHPNPQGAGAIFQAIWPHLWLVIRLVLLMLWFTSGLGWSWTRWCGVVAVLFAIIVINSGLLNGRLENAWQPVRQHLERLLPLADPGQANAAGGAVPPAAAPGDVNNRQEQAPPVADRQNARAQPDPREAAERMVAARREANANWLLDQVRRVERAGLLFLASIAPGVAEPEEQGGRQEIPNTDIQGESFSIIYSSAAHNGGGATRTKCPAPRRFHPYTRPHVESTPTLPRRDSDIPRPTGSFLYLGPDSQRRLYERSTTEYHSLSDDESKDSGSKKRRKGQKVKQSLTRRRNGAMPQVHGGTVYNINEATYTLGAGCQPFRDVTNSSDVQAILDNIQQWSAPINMMYLPAGVSTVIGSSTVDFSDTEDSVTTLEADNHPVRPLA